MFIVSVCILWDATFSSIVPERIIVLSMLNEQLTFSNVKCCEQSLGMARGWSRGWGECHPLSLDSNNKGDGMLRIASQPSVDDWLAIRSTPSPLLLESKIQ